MNINIQIYNRHGELVDKHFVFSTLDEARNLDFNKVIDEAENYGKENMMIDEELFDSKEEAEFNKENIYDNDLTNTHFPSLKDDLNKILGIK